MQQQVYGLKNRDTGNSGNCMLKTNLTLKLWICSLCFFQYPLQDLLHTQFSTLRKADMDWNRLKRIKQICQAIEVSHRETDSPLYIRPRLGTRKMPSPIPSAHRTTFVALRHRTHRCHPRQHKSEEWINKIKTDFCTFMLFVKLKRTIYSIRRNFIVCC